MGLSTGGSVMRTLAAVLVVVGFVAPRLPGAMAYRFLEPTFLAKRGGRAMRDMPRYFRQRLDNFKGLQYHGNIEVGGQTLTAIFDTGSHDLLVVSHRCEICKHHPYDARKSATFVTDGEQVTHSFGSGPVATERGRDEVRVGPFIAENQTIFEIVDHNISSLGDEFTAIAGISPDPKSPTSLLHGINVSEYSFCLERGDDAPGWLTWGSQLTAEQRSQAVELSSVGDRLWAVSMTKFVPSGLQLDAQQADAAGLLLCERGCAAVLDSGTSLIAAPSEAIAGLSHLLPEIHANCSNFLEMPDVELRLGGHSLLLPPEAYVMRLNGTWAEAGGARDFLQIPPSDTSESHQCFLGVLKMNYHTEYGPLWVLGMPFFRFFHTTFGLKRTGSQLERRIWVSEASDDCQPLPVAGASKDTDEGPKRYEGIGVHPRMGIAQFNHQLDRQGAHARGPLVVDPRSLRLPRFSPEDIARL